MKRVLINIFSLLFLAVFFHGCAFEHPLHREKTGEGDYSPESIIDEPTAVVPQREPPTEKKPVARQGGEKIVEDMDENYGWRVQIFITTEQAEAEARRVEAERVLGQNVYLSYSSPHYKLRVGNCRTYDEAMKLLERVKTQGFPDAFIVRDRITPQ